MFRCRIDAPSLLQPSALNSFELVYTRIPPDYECVVTVGFDHRPCTWECMGTLVLLTAVPWTLTIGSGSAQKKCTICYYSRGRHYHRLLGICFGRERSRCPADHSILSAATADLTWCLNPDIYYTRCTSLPICSFSPLRPTLRLFPSSRRDMIINQLTLDQRRVEEAHRQIVHSPRTRPMHLSEPVYSEMDDVPWRQYDPAGSGRGSLVIVAVCNLIHRQWILFVRRHQRAIYIVFNIGELRQKFGKDIK